MGASPSKGNYFADQNIGLQRENAYQTISKIEKMIAEEYKSQDVQEILNSGQQLQDKVCGIYALFKERFDKWDYKSLQTAKKSLFTGSDTVKIGQKVGELNTDLDRSTNPMQVSVETRKQICSDLIKYVTEKIQLLQAIKNNFDLGKEGCILLPGQLAQKTDLTEEQKISYADLYRVYQDVIQQNNQIIDRNSGDPEGDQEGLLITPKEQSRADGFFKQLKKVQDQWFSTIGSILKELETKPDLTYKRLQELKKMYMDAETNAKSNCNTSLQGLSPLRGVVFTNEGFVRNGEIIDSFRF